jgi:hypothetical protein
VDIDFLADDLFQDFECLILVSSHFSGFCKQPVIKFVEYPLNVMSHFSFAVFDTLVPEIPVRNLSHQFIWNQVPVMFIPQMHRKRTSYEQMSTDISLSILYI